MKHRTSRSRRIVVIASVAVLGVTGVGVALAYWTATGTGTGQATTGTSVALIIDSEAPVGILAPGGVGQTVAFTVTNPATNPQYLTSVTVELADENGVPWVPTGDCNAADYVATISTAPPAGNIPATGSVTGQATVTLTNTAQNQDACQGQTVPLYFSATVPN